MLKDRKITKVISQRPCFSLYSLTAAAVILALMAEIEALKRERRNP